MKASTKPLDPEVLVSIFHDDPDELATFEWVAEQYVPEAYRRLLAHDAHMTVTLEAWHRSPVDVHVLESRLTETHYARKSVLTRQSDAAPVQFGVVRLNLAYLNDEIRHELQACQTPLGRILIQHDVMREVEQLALWRVTPTAKVAQPLGMEQGMFTFGRTAIIHWDGEAAIELLEIVSPAD